MKKFLQDYAKQYHLPNWFITLNYWSFLLPTAIYPLVFYGSIFLLDHPENLLSGWGLVLLIDSYPFILYGNVLLSFRLFFALRPVAIFLPLIPLAVFLYLIFLLLFN